MKNRLCSIAVFLLFMVAASAVGQKPKLHKAPNNKAKIAEPIRAKSTNDAVDNEKKVKDMVTFLVFMLNTIGSSATSVRDKDVLINESYSKLFRDSKVQIEDDLDEERRVITNKDAVAYLKDINFFFTNVKFEFTIEKIEEGINNNHQIFYKVSLHRNLSGITSDGKTVNNIVPRFIEINFNPKEQDLKIVSIYSHEPNDKEAIRNWWNQLSYEWQTLFRKKISISDSVTLDDLHKITSIEELDISNNRYILSLEPLSQLTLLRTLNLSNTSVSDLTPIRNLTDLIELNLSRTAVQDLSALKYSNNLIKLNISHSAVIDISILQRMPKLQVLDLSVTNIIDFSGIASLNELTSLNLRSTSQSQLTFAENLKLLTELNISQTPIVDLSPLKELTNLKIINCDSSRVQNIAALAILENLKVLYANYTLISNLQPLQKLTHFEKIYCDHTLIKKAEADAFMASNPSVLVIYDSHDLQFWWTELSSEWKVIISETAKINTIPSVEELARVDAIDSINCGGNNRITDLTPLHRLEKLRVLIANQTSIQDLSPIRELLQISYLNISETNVTNLSVLRMFTKLKIVNADHCKIESIDPLRNLTHLEKLYVDETGINDITAQEFLATNSTCLLIYKTIHLNRWWRKLSGDWREVIRAQVADTTRERFHQLVEQGNFHFKDAPVIDLSGISEFIRLKELAFSGTAIVNIEPLENLISLQSLHATNGPIKISESLGQLTELENLDISNTPIEELTAITKLQKLKTLNCSGTQVKKLDALIQLKNLESLDCSNTNVTKLASLDHLNLKTLKCYNTRVSKRTIANFEVSHPLCKVIYYR